MDFTFLYWHWIAFGLLLILAELFIPKVVVMPADITAAIRGIMGSLGK